MAKKLNKMCQYFHATDLYDCPKCGAKLRDYKQELLEKCKLVPIELKQTLLDNLKQGMTVGEAIKSVDPDEKHEHIVWTQIIADQIEVSKYYSFNFTAK